MGGHDWYVGHTKVPDIWTYQNEHNQGDLYLTKVIVNDIRAVNDIFNVL
jgi:hypothetical protein